MNKGFVHRCTRAVRIAIVVMVVVGATAQTTGQASAQRRTVRLPTDLDAMALAPLSQLLLYGQGGIETQLPGPVSDRERVAVGIHTDGSISRVTVTQRLTVTGLGDFSFRVPGPARNVESLPGSSGNPGLRKGSVLWQGFSSGREVLAAEVELMPNLERRRLPLSFDLRMTVGGEPLHPKRRASGPFRLTFRITNASGSPPFGVERARAEPAALAPALDRLRTLLRAGKKPVPGTAGIPKAVPIEGRVTQEATEVPVPFAIGGTLSFPQGTLRGVQVRGATLKSTGDATIVTFGRTLGGGAPDELILTVSGIATDLGLPNLTMNGRPSLPSPAAVEPQVGSTWVEGVRRRPSAFDGREMLSVLMDTMWQVARIRQFRAYLGNPDFQSEDSRSTYVFTLAPRVAPPPIATPPQPARAGPFAIAAFSLATLVALTGLALLWSRS